MVDEASPASSAAPPHAYLVAARRKANAAGVVHLLRFGSGTPLLSQGAACAITDGVVRRSDWSALGLAVTPVTSTPGAMTGAGALSQRTRRLLGSHPATAAAFDTTDADLDGAYVALSAIGDDPIVAFACLRILVNVQVVHGESGCCCCAELSTDARVIHRCDRVTFGDLAKTHIGASDAGYAAVVTAAMGSAVAALTANVPGVFSSAAARRDALLFGSFIPTIASELAAIVALAPAADDGAPPGFRELALAAMAAADPSALEVSVTERLLAFTEGTMSMHARAASAAAAAAADAAAAGADAGGGSDAPAPVKKKRTRGARAAAATASKAAAFEPLLVSPDPDYDVQASEPPLADYSPYAPDHDGDFSDGDGAFTEAVAHASDAAQRARVASARDAAREEWREAAVAQQERGRARLERKAATLAQRRALWQPPREESLAAGGMGGAHGACADAEAQPEEWEDLGGTLGDEEGGDTHAPSYSDGLESESGWPELAGQRGGSYSAGAYGGAAASAAAASGWGTQSLHRVWGGESERQ